MSPRFMSEDFASWPIADFYGGWLAALGTCLLAGLALVFAGQVALFALHLRDLMRDARAARHGTANDADRQS